MSEEADVRSGLMKTADEQENREEKGVERGSVLESQMTVIMTDDKDSTITTTSKEKGEKGFDLNELGSSPFGSFQSLQSSQSNEEDKRTSNIPPVGGMRVLRFEDTLSEEDHRNFYLIYESLLLEGRAGNLTNLTLNMVLAEKPPTWL